MEWLEGVVWNSTIGGFSVAIMVIVSICCFVADNQNDSVCTILRAHTHTRATKYRVSIALLSRDTYRNY